MKKQLIFLLSAGPYAPVCTKPPPKTRISTYQGKSTGAAPISLARASSSSRYLARQNVNFQATAAATRTAGGLLNSITDTSGGDGYTTAPTVTITGGGGSGATAIVHVSADAVLAITISNHGTGYTSDPTVTIAPPPANLVYPTFWSNDGTSNQGSQPAVAVAVGVTNGLFTVGVGDTTQSNMLVPIRPRCSPSRICFWASGSMMARMGLRS